MKISKPRKKSVFVLVLVFLLTQTNILYPQKNSKDINKLFLEAKKSQNNLNWQDSLNKFSQVTASFPQSEYAQQAYIEIGKFHKYHRDWEKAIGYYHQSIAISPKSRPAHDAKTAEAAIYYFRQDFPRALTMFKEVLSETKDWDQIKYCSYWIKEITRRMSFSDSLMFSCGPKALKVVFKLLNINAKDEELKRVFSKPNGELSILELKKAALEE